jgi:hypothetical protein
VCVCPELPREGEGEKEMTGTGREVCRERDDKKRKGGRESRGKVEEKGKGEEIQRMRERKSVWD